MTLLTGTPFGNLTGSGGLAAVFDGTEATVGFHEGQYGWVGISLPAPKRIAKAEIVSPSNGYDASGLKTAITLRLRAKQGTAPSSQTDGVVIGEFVAFIDKNERTQITLHSLNWEVEWDHVWIDMITGVWCVVSEIRIYEAPAIIEETVSATNTLTGVCAPQGMPIPWNGVMFPQYTRFIAAENGDAVKLDYYIDAAHQGDLFSPKYNDAIGVGAVLRYKFAETFAGLPAAQWQTVPNMKATSGFNIDERNPAHYGNTAVNAVMQLQGGFYLFGVLLTAHTDANGWDGLACINYDGFVIDYRKNTTVKH